MRRQKIKQVDIRNIQFVLRPRRLDEIFDFAILLLREKFAQYARFLAFPAFVLIALNSLVCYYLYEQNEEAAIWSKEQLWMLLLLFAERSLFSQALVLFNGRLLFEKRPSVFSIWKEFLKSLPYYIWHQIVLRGIYLFLLWPFLLFPIRSVLWHFFKSEALLLEKLQGQFLRKRLSNLGQNLTDRVLAFLAMEMLLFFLYLIFFSFAWNQFLELFHVAGRYWWLDAALKRLFLSPVLCLFLLPYWFFHTNAKFLFYIDTRSLREGWDIELQLVRGVLENGAMQKQEIKYKL